MINPSSRAQNCSEVARSCAPVCHTSSHLQGRDVSECKTSIGSRGNQSVSAEELRSGTARVWISELGERVWHWHKEDGHLSPPAASFFTCLSIYTLFLETIRRVRGCGDVHGRAQPVLRVKLQPVVRVLRRGLRCGYDEEAVVLHRGYSAGRGCREHPGLVSPHGAYGTPPPPPRATGALRQLAAAPFSRRSGSVRVRSAGESHVAISQTRASADVRVQNCI